MGLCHNAQDHARMLTPPITNIAGTQRECFIGLELQETGPMGRGQLSQPTYDLTQPFLITWAEAAALAPRARAGSNRAAVDAEFT